MLPVPLDSALLTVEVLSLLALEEACCLPAEKVRRRIAGVFVRLLLEDLVLLAIGNRLVVNVVEVGFLVLHI
jgi:hypothetical protein